MSVRNSILALLADGPTHGYQLKKGIEALTIGMWPINDGQIYTTLGRLERDGLVEDVPTEDEQRLIALTDEGRAELDAWFDETRSPNASQRDELTIKIAFALDRPGLISDVRLTALIARQRDAAMSALQQLTRTKAGLESGDIAQAAVLEAAIGRISAELTWLDGVDQHRSTRRWAK